MQMRNTHATGAAPIVTGVGLVSVVRDTRGVSTDARRASLILVTREKLTYGPFGGVRANISFKHRELYLLD